MFGAPSDLLLCGQTCTGVRVEETGRKERRAKALTKTSSVRKLRGWLRVGLWSTSGRPWTYLGPTLDQGRPRIDFWFALR